MLRLLVVRALARIAKKSRCTEVSTHHVRYHCELRENPQVLATLDQTCTDVCRDRSPAPPPTTARDMRWSPFYRESPAVRHQCSSSWYNFHVWGIEHVTVHSVLLLWNIWHRRLGGKKSVCGLKLGTVGCWGWHLKKHEKRKHEKGKNKTKEHEKRKHEKRKNKTKEHEKRQNNNKKQTRKKKNEHKRKTKK